MENESEIYKECYTEINKVNRRLVKLATTQTIAFCVALIAVIGLLAGFYFCSNYGYGNVSQIQASGETQTQTTTKGDVINDQH